jgi:4-amino-4-deoxy-L-arabinose transferase-like glycosyltransferase
MRKIMRPGFTIGILVCAALCIRLAFVFLLPPTQTVSFRLEGLNDEASHLNYVHYLAQHRQFPVQRHHAREKDSFVRNEFEYYQAPVYYLLGAALESVVGKNNSLLACRLLSFLFGALSLLVIKRIFSSLSFPAAFGNGAVLFTAFLPTHAYFCSVASNDALSWLLALLLTLEMAGLCVAEGAFGSKKLWRSALYSGLLLGIGMLTKTSLLLFVPVVAGIFLYRFFVSRNRQWLSALAAVLCIAAVLAGPWYLRNLQVYGSLFAFDVGNGPPQFFLFSAHQFVRFLKLALYCFWFPMQHVPPSHAVGAMLWCEVIIMLANGALFAAYAVSKKRIALWEIFLAGLLLLNIAAYINYNLHWDNADGRFLFPSLAALLVFFCVPLYHFSKGPRLQRFVAPLLVCEALFPYLLLLLVP